MIKVNVPDNTPAGEYNIVPVTAPVPVPVVRPLGPGDLVVDLSRHNQVKDLFPKLKAAGVRGVILRATMGATGLDEKFIEYWELAEKQEFDFLSTYHLFIKESPWAAQANNFLTVLGTRHITYPLTVDFEPRTGEVVTSTAQVRENFKPLVYELQQRIAYSPVTYTAGWAIDKFMFGGETWLSEFPLHAAHYTTAAKPFIPRPWHDNGNVWFAWQYDTGQYAWSNQWDIPGLESVNIDKNRYSGMPFPAMG